MTTTTTTSIITGAGSAINVRAEQATDSSIAMHHVPEVAGAPVSTGNPMPVQFGGALPAGANIIGAVNVNGIPQVAQSGAWSFSLGAPIPAGNNPIGAVTINGNPAVAQSGAWSVSLGSALPAGNNAIGSVSVSNLPATQTVQGAVSIAAPIPAGANAIGSVSKVSFPIADVQSVACSATAGQAVQVVPYSATRRVLHIFNRTTGQETVDIGPTNAVTVNGGIPLYASGGFSFDGQGAAGPFWAVSPVASTPLSYAEG